ncbi:MAG: 6,7-dimethyl-8-ribityllumazine synthase [Bacteroidota bacterium]|nr:6,7-dimethyl-8-ribityllumazine synthase [Bacteroidota bacterium]
MASSVQNLSIGTISKNADCSKFKIAIVVAEWNADITESLFTGAKEALIQSGVREKNIIRTNVPGSFELTLGCQWMASNLKVDAVIALGCVVMGDTPHFDYICQSVSYGITELNIKFNKPIIFGVLTTLNQQQALDRAGGKHGNKGHEAAITALKMLLVWKGKLVKKGWALA